MWASTHRTAEWSDQCMNLSGKAKATAMKQGKLELNQVAQVAWTCWQDVEGDGLPQLMWLGSPDWSPNAEGKDFSQVLHLTVTPLQWDPVQGQVSAVKIQLHTDTDTQTNDALWFQSTCAHSSWCWDPHLLGVQHHRRQLHPCRGSRAGTKHPTAGPRCSWHLVLATFTHTRDRERDCAEGELGKD